VQGGEQLGAGGAGGAVGGGGQIRANADGVDEQVAGLGAEFCVQVEREPVARVGGDLLVRRPRRQVRAAVAEQEPSGDTAGYEQEERRNQIADSHGTARSRSGCA